ncbi:MAG: hypothetical protein KJ057_17245 [Phycisphaerae bacterium]|nr:MAG: hypothetical protein F9K17_14005 [Phycisphaerae bacterium]MCL4720211.1 hypothetical protein [Phycisphaerae bacterium]
MLQRYAPKIAAGLGGQSVVTEIDAPDDLGAFGWLRGVKDFSRMLELRRKDGSILAVGYGYLDHAEFNPSEGITLSVAGRKIRIKGRNLNAEVRPTVRLFEGITRHRVPWIQEADRAVGIAAEERDTVIDVIEW